MTYFEEVKQEDFIDASSDTRDDSFLGPPIQYLGTPNPAIDGDGLDEGGVTVLVDPPVPITINDQGQITHGYAVIPQPPAPIIAADGKIFGIEPLYLGIGAIALLFLFSSK